MAQDQTTAVSVKTLVGRRAEILDGTARAASPARVRVGARIGLDQTSIEHFNANNAFDAEGLTKLTEQIEARKKRRNDIEQDTRVRNNRSPFTTSLARKARRQPRLSRKAPSRWKRSTLSRSSRSTGLPEMAVAAEQAAE